MKAAKGHMKKVSDFLTRHDTQTDLEVLTTIQLYEEETSKNQLFIKNGITILSISNN